MSEQDRQGLPPAADGEGSSADSPSGGVPLEPLAEDAAEPADIQALDVCPSCGAALGGINTLVCLRCGFDLKAMKPLKTAVGPPQEVSSIERNAGEALSPPGRGDLWLPAAVALSAAMLLLVGYLAGAPGLFRVEGEAAVPLLTRCVGLLKFLLATALLSACGVGALVGYARAAGRPLGDLRLAAMRMLAIVATTSLAGFIHLSKQGWEWPLETLLQAAAFVGLAMLVFRIAIREALALAALVLVAVLVLLVASAAMVWAITPMN